MSHMHALSHKICRPAAIMRLSGHLCDYEVVSRGVCHVTAVGRLAETAVGGPERVGGMYQNPTARLWLTEEVGM
jgi:hypothetical protein